MAEQPAPIALTPEELKETYYKDKAKHSALLSRLEAPKDRKFIATITKGPQTYRVAYRELLHGEVALVGLLPFFYKLIADPPQKLTEQEQARYDALKAELLDMAILDESRPTWEKLAGDPRIADLMWQNVAYSSGLDKSFADQLDEFLTDNIGFNYGDIVFGLLRRTPSEVALLPEKDVVFANVWYQKWSERSKPK
jgi:hypothetical protein